MNITLIGMSGVGKSFIGEKLAEALGYGFIDVDRIIEGRHNLPLQGVLDVLGEPAFLQEEESSIFSLVVTEASVIAPGGSVVYSARAMNELRRISIIVYLASDIEVLASKVDPHARGIVGLKNSNFRALYQERKVLYERYADHQVVVDDTEPDQIVSEIIALSELRQKLA